MKKRLFTLLSVIVVMALTVIPVSAAFSPTAETATILADAAKSDDGSMNVLDQGILTEAFSLVEDLASVYAGVTSETPQGAPAEEGQVVIVNDNGEAEIYTPEVVAAFDFEPADSVKAEIEATGSAQVEFAVADVVAGDNVLLLHFIESLNEWETLIPDEVKDGVVVSTFTSFSPIVLVKLIPEEVPTGATPQGAPQTGVASLLGIAAFGCVAGAVFAGKKRIEK